MGVIDPITSLMKAWVSVCREEGVPASVLYIDGDVAKMVHPDVGIGVKADIPIDLPLEAEVSLALEKMKRAGARIRMVIPYQALDKQGRPLWGLTQMNGFLSRHVPSEDAGE